MAWVTGRRPGTSVERTAKPSIAEFVKPGSGRAAVTGEAGMRLCAAASATRCAGRRRSVAMTAGWASETERMEAGGPYRGRPEAEAIDVTRSRNTGALTQRRPDVP